MYLAYSAKLKAFVWQVGVKANINIAIQGLVIIWSNTVHIVISTNNQPSLYQPCLFSTVHKIY